MAGERSDFGFGVAAILSIVFSCSGCAGILGIEDATDELAPPATPCEDGGVEVQTSTGTKCVRRYRIDGG